MSDNYAWAEVQLVDVLRAIEHKLWLVENLEDGSAVETLWPNAYDPIQPHNQRISNWQNRIKDLIPGRVRSHDTLASKRADNYYHKKVTIELWTVSTFFAALCGRGDFTKTAEDGTVGEGGHEPWCLRKAHLYREIMDALDMLLWILDGMTPSFSIGQLAAAHPSKAEAEAAYPGSLEVRVFGFSGFGSTAAYNETLSIYSLGRRVAPLDYTAPHGQSLAPRIARLMSWVNDPGNGAGAGYEWSTQGDDVAREVWNEVLVVALATTDTNIFVPAPAISDTPPNDWPTPPPPGEAYVRGWSEFDCRVLLQFDIGGL